MPGDTDLFEKVSGASVSDKTRRALKDFGLTEYEVKTYVALV